MSDHVTAAHLATAAALVEQAHAAGGLAPIDLDRFWAEQAASGDPLNLANPQLTFGAFCNWECVFEEMGVPQDWKRYRDDGAWALALNKAYNDKAQKIVGRRLLPETPPGPPAPAYPPIRQLHDIFEMVNRWDDISQAWWLLPAASTPDELAVLLDRVDRRLETLRDFLLPPGWDDAKAALLPQGLKPPLYRGQRGPVTFAMSLFGVEGIIFLIEDHPALAARLRDTILRAMLAIAALQDAEAGFTPQTAPHGFSFADDNCAMLTADMYEFFALPIVRGIWDVYSPAPADARYQHSDSAMGHIMPVLGRCSLTGVNFGPTLRVDEIRRHNPRAVIYGQLAPFTYCRNEEVNMVAELLRDFELCQPARGLVFTTAGSVNNGSRLTGMRLLMSAIQHHARFDR